MFVFRQFHMQSKAVRDRPAPEEIRDRVASQANEAGSHRCEAKESQSDSADEDRVYRNHGGCVDDNLGLHEKRGFDRCCRFRFHKSFFWKFGAQRGTPHLPGTDNHFRLTAEMPERHWELYHPTEI
jgi:hypothetical protein